MSLPTELIFKQLCKAQWDWLFCSQCKRMLSCDSHVCPSRRLKRLSKYLGYCRDISASYELELSQDEVSQLWSLVLDLIGLLRLSPNVERADIVRNLSEAAPGKMNRDIERSLSISIRVMFMINCGVDKGVSDFLETGSVPRQWEDETTLVRFIKDAFPISDHPSINEDSPSSISLKNSLRARKLKKHAGLRFLPTNDIREHLRLDYRTGIVQIFHLTSFVKEQLRSTKYLGWDASVEDCVERGALPRQLLLEIIDSIQRVLFPISDPKSYALLESLTGAVPGTFDPDCLRFESDDELRQAYEKETKYFYFGSRLMDLHRELQDPTPRGFFSQWLERRSGARYAMLATIIGVFIAVILSLLSLALSSYQTWIAYQQWQHPVQN